MRLLHTAPGDPLAVLCPLPDPKSFGVLVHWLYWCVFLPVCRDPGRTDACGRGDTAALESALSRGLVSWQGLVRNVDYLDMDDAIKRAVGKWWRRWVRPATGRSTGAGRGEPGERAWYAGSPGSDSAIADSGDEADGEEVMEVERGHVDGERDEVEEGVAGLMRGL